jgi:hypothetical protein
MNIKFSNWLKPTPAKVSNTIKLVCGALMTTTLVMEKPYWAAIIAVVGAIAEGMIGPKNEQ